MSGTGITIVLVVVFGFLFNITRWFEYETEKAFVIFEDANINTTMTIISVS